MSAINVSLQLLSVFRDNLLPLVTIIRKNRVKVTNIYKTSIFKFKNPNKYGPSLTQKNQLLLSNKFFTGKSSSWSIYIHGKQSSQVYLIF
jgi:hypothetical protein